MLGANAFPYYAEGSGKGQVFVGDPNGEPFIVRARNAGWLPLNVIIFASSEEDAIARVKDGLTKASENNRRDDDTSVTIGRYRKMLALFDEGVVEVSPFDKTYVCKIDWDTRGLG